MRIGPPKRAMPPRPFALLTPGYRAVTVETVAGKFHFRGPKRCYSAISRLETHTVYVNGSITALRHTTGAKVWHGATWRGRATSMSLDGTTVVVQSLRGALEGSPDPFGELATAMAWFEAHGVRAGSMSGMGWALWRSTLTRDVVIAARPALGRAGLYGGRQEVRNHLDGNGNPRELSHMVAVDITGAYPHAMASAPYATGLRRVDRSTPLDPTVPGMVEATVGVDADMPYRPLPLRLAADMIVFPHGYVTGIWPWCEVAAAIDLGCSVKVSKCWAPTGLDHLFGPDWSAAIAEARTLSPAAARIVKTAANSTWGMFGMRGDQRESLRWTDEAGLQPLRVPLAEVPLPHASTCHVAAETSARVRVRMLREGLYGAFASPVHVDTDGIIVRRSSVRGLPTSSSPGEWRAKTTMARVDIRAPQVYRYTCGKGCGIAHAKYHYVTAGTPPDLARSLFERMGDTGGWVSGNGIDIVLPTGSANDRAGLLSSARSARSEIGRMTA